VKPRRTQRSRRVESRGRFGVTAGDALRFPLLSTAVLDGTVPHAGPVVAKLIGGERRRASIPVVAIAKPLVLAGILEGADPWQHWPEVVAVVGHRSSTPRCSRPTTSSHRGGIPLSLRCAAVSIAAHVTINIVTVLLLAAGLAAGD
jgi:hypothetical protein